MAARQKCLQWHSVRVAQPPDGAVVLARSDVCSIQAMRIGNHTWSMQYHVELEQSTIPDWSKVPAYEQALSATLGAGALKRLEEKAQVLMPAFAKDARQLYSNFMRLAAKASAVTGQASPERVPSS